MSRLPRFAALAAALLLLGCSTKIVVCPVPAILADTAAVTVMRPGATADLANELYTVTLQNAQLDCVFNQTTTVVRSSLALTFRATRAPTSEAASYSVPYFVVVNEGAKIYAKRNFTLKFTFAPGAASSTIVQTPETPEIRIENGKLPWNYQMLAGFQLTKAQMDYNQMRGRYLP